MSSEDESSNDGCMRCPPGLAHIVRLRLGQRHDYLESKYVIVAHIPPNRNELADTTRDWSRYQEEVPILVMRGPYWNKDSQIAFTRHELMDMELRALNPILDRFKLRKTSRTKRDVVERIIEKLIRENDPWLIRSQRYWNSREELF